MLGSVHHVVAVERADGDELHVVERAELRQKILDLVADFLKAFFLPVHEIHFVDGKNHVRNAEQRGDVSVPARLLDDAKPRVHEDDGKVGRAGAGDHVAGVLHMTGRVSYDELAFRRGEIAICDVNCDALFALGAQAVGEVRQINLAATGDVGGFFQRLDLVFHQRLGIVKQPADERGLAVINTAAGVEAQKFDGMLCVGHEIIRADKSKESLRVCSGDKCENLRGQW